MSIPQLNLSNLNGLNGFRLGKDIADNRLYSVDSAGDVNGDGFDDFIAGAPDASSNGVSYVIFGKATGFDIQMNLSDLNGSNGFRLNGDSQFGGFVGYSVSSAGDVNGDGFDDVIVGAPQAEYNGVQSGSSYVMFGKATGFDAAMNVSSLNGDNGFRLDGATEDETGYEVSSAGDINGDGFDDLIVGASGANPIANKASYVIFGKASGFDAAIDLSDLDGSNGFRFNGAHVSSAGDVNGDGIDDLAIGGGYSKGSAVVFGTTSGFEATMDVSSINGSNGFVIDGGEDFQQYSELSSSRLSIHNTGDINGDGLDDLIVNVVPYVFDYATAPEDRNYVIFGKSNGFSATVDLSNLDDSDGFLLLGAAAGEQLNGDFNGDGLADLLLGAEAVRNRITPIPGYIVFGKNTGFGSEVNVKNLSSESGVRLTGSATYDQAGHSISNAGDINGDGVDDVIVGGFAKYSKSDLGYVVFGNTAFSSEVIPGSAGEDDIAGTVATEHIDAGDGDDILTGNGGEDVLQGDAGDDVIKVPDVGFLSVEGGAGDDTLELTGSGIDMDLSRVMVSGIETIDLAGSGNNTLKLTPLDVFHTSDTTRTLMVRGNTGDRVTGLSDGWADGGVQGDAHVFTKQGMVLLIDSDIQTDAFPAGAISLQSLSLNGSNGFRLEGVLVHVAYGPDIFSYSNLSVSSAGDVNGDGFDDVIAGIDGASPNGDASGSSFVVFGHAGGFDVTVDLNQLDGHDGFRLDGVESYDFSGSSVSNAGDVNGDGFDDVIVGMGIGAYETGSCYVVFGKASGFDASMSLSGLDGSNGFRLDGAGKSFSDGSDINGDGFDDVIVYSGVDSYVVFGRASGFDASLNLANLDGSNGFRLDGAGVSASGAGDINGDGFDDVIVNSGVDSYVVFGRASGFDASLNLANLDGSNGFRLNSGRASVSDAGDINGDGFADVAVNSGINSYVVFGHAADFDATVDVNQLDGNNGFRVVANDNSYAYSVRNAGDVNGDGFDDVLIAGHGVPQFYGYPNDTASGYIIFGKASGFNSTLALSSLDGSNGIRLDVGEIAMSISVAGDVNGDGFDDVMVGTNSQQLGHSGTGYILFGRSDFGSGGGGELLEITGTAGADTLKGSDAAEHFIAGDGNDNLLGLGGADVFDAGAGDDAIRIGDLTFASIDGGEGNDALHLAGSGMNLDLSVLGDYIHNIETICLYGRGDNTLTLTADSLLNLSDSAHTLKVHGNSGDHIVVQDSGWVDGGSQGFYHTYTHDDAVLLVGANVVIDFV